MGAAPPSDEVVTIRLGDPTVICINCADKIGLSGDFARIILEAGLSVVRADLSRDGQWCYLVFWVVPRPGPKLHINWKYLKRNLIATCPPNPLHIFFMTYLEPKPSNIYILHVCSWDRTHLLHDVAKAFWELEFSVHKIKVVTTPEEKVMGLFFITDKRDLLHTKNRQEEICNHLQYLLGDSSTQCKLEVAPSDIKSMDYAPISLLPPSFVEELFNSEAGELKDDSTKKYDSRNKQSPDLTGKNISVTIDNALSPAHTLVQIACKDRRGLLYDILRTLKDYSFQVSYGRLATTPKGKCEVDVFVLQADGRKIIDKQKQSSVCLRLKQEILDPVRVVVADCGPDTVLLVATRMELSGTGRPRVLYDVTLVLKALGIPIFSADMGRYSVDDLQWEVYKFLLIDRPDLSLGTQQKRGQLTGHIKNILIG
eukprot:TRINITY_DN5731_c1_g1_i1.p1 TRINITY_DN5731_c1_g1~~TRINITY_DN5731_c1_g1_i1.p1  ORF type:complete len:426 (-),score=59.46 TRINITY_DN5731_c1_g1_i1:926-2203(-)